MKEIPSPEQFSYDEETIKTIFELNPELSTIGTPSEYDHYQESVFPESKVQQILWHTSNEKNMQGANVFSTKRVEKGLYGFYMADNVDGSYGNELYGVRINIAKGKEVDALTIVGFDEEDVQKLKQEEVDCVYASRTANGEYLYSEIVVFDVEKILILGSQKDLQGFREWKESNQ